MSEENKPSAVELPADDEEEEYDDDNYDDDED